VADRSAKGPWHPAAALPLLLIIGPYYVNKFIYLAYPGDYVVFIVADYTNRAVTLAALWLVVRGAPVRFAMPWRLDGRARKDWLVAVVGILILIVVDALASPAKEWLNDYTGRLTRYPTPTDHPALGMLDTTFGCLLTAISEEAIFRFYLINVLVLRGLSVRGALGVSTALFAAIHWSYGGGNVAYAGFAGLVIALVYVATGNLFAPVLIHAAVDTYFFSDADAVVRGLIW
jgi:membrane protease YdiL (CAAX protease family)